MDKKIPDGVVLTAAYALSREWNLHYPDAVRMAALVLSVGQQHPEWQPMGVEGLIEDWESNLAEDKRDGVAEVAIRVQEIHLEQLRTLSQQHAAERVDVCKLVALAEQWERDADVCRRDGYIDAAVVKEDCAYRIRQTLGISAIAEALTTEGRQAGECCVPDAGESSFILPGRDPLVQKLLSIAIKDRAEQSAAEAERAFFAQDFYEEAREGKKPWPGQQAAAVCTCPHQDAREPHHDVACPARRTQQGGEVT